MGRTTAKRERRQVAVPVVLFLATFVRTFSPWILPLLGVSLIVVAAFMVAVPLGLAIAGLACFAIRALYEMQGSK
jgi:apolipoprotein N-acyltransferase